MDSMAVRRLEGLVVTRTGLQVRDRDRDAFCCFVESRMKVLRLAHPEAYHQLLASDGNGNSSEWKQLVSALANNESYFFRDGGQFSLLKFHLLPELIAQNRRRCSLRLWSAGCSTGEEPYSLAILVDQLLPLKDHWEVRILGTDLDGEALQRAREGVYDKWSFRALPPDIQRHYFHERRGVWEVDDRIRKMVTFQLGNLLSDPFPNRSMGICDLDLILCRNVFIYFDRGAVSQVLRKLADSLSEGGHLVTGHAELHDQKLACLKMRFFAESVVYQRIHGGTTKALLEEAEAFPPPPKPMPSPLRLASPSPPGVNQRTSEPYTLTFREPAPSLETGSPLNLEDTTASASSSGALLSEAESLLRDGKYLAALERLEVLLRSEPRNSTALSLAARAHANLGEHEKAASLCRTAIELDPLEATPYYLLAHIVEEQGDSTQARELLKKVLYLAPGLVTPYLELGAMYERESDATRAQSMRNSALELLAHLPAGAPADPYGALTAGELTRQLQEAVE